MSPSGEGRFEITWSPRRGRGGRRELTPTAVSWLERSIARLTDEFDWDRFRSVQPGTFPLTTAPRDEFRWDYITRGGGTGGLRLSWSGGECNLPVGASDTARLGRCGRELARLIEAATAPLRTAAAAIREGADGWATDRLLAEVSADGWPAGLKLPSAPRTVAVAHTLAKCLTSMVAPTGWESLARLTRIAPPALQELLPWEARYDPEVLGLGYVFCGIRVHSRDAVVAYRMGAELFGCDPSLSALDPVLSRSAEPDRDPSSLVSSTWYSSALARGLVAGAVRTRYGWVPVPTAENRAAIRGALASEGLVSRRFPDRLRGMLARTSSELVNWPWGPGDAVLAHVQRLGLLAWDIGEDENPAVLTARSLRDEFLSGVHEPAPRPSEGSDE